MSVNPRTPPAKPPAVFGNDAAPFVYADAPIAWGFNGSGLQIELVATTFVPSEPGVETVRTRPVVTAHLRMGPAAAQQLAVMISGALEKIVGKGGGETEPAKPAKSKMDRKE